MVGAGIASDVFGVLWVTTIQREIPERALSRISSYDWFGSLAFAPLGLLVAGPVAAAVGTGLALAGCAALIVLATMAALLSPQGRTLRTATEAPSTAAALTRGERDNGLRLRALDDRRRRLSLAEAGGRAAGEAAGGAAGFGDRERHVVHGGRDGLGVGAPAQVTVWSPGLIGVVPNERGGRPARRRR